ncbi:GLE1-domain-containing protein [Pseudovirgaria hyperparasitica]|uniref:mRNA export factor GLE1 n=1 Tax=Pseudovirgaria hyperparasitica TaxID=470096 RepID=A0A6A6WFJ7_9PEZI|nr:GLE1-domain-containing protein [Pseudovirgaria hyperparasitica]KAF2761592.1 GLE1-domain-containing protein [Pseudovirgaria hyperparasitica]
MPKSPRSSYTPPPPRPRRPSRRYSPTFASTPRTDDSGSHSSSQPLRSSRYNGSSHRNSFDSPSRQLMEEFSQMMLDEDRTFQASLDKFFQEQEVIHRAALDEVALEHERVRKSAEVARETHDLQIQKEIRRREEEAQKKLERARAEKEEAEHARKLAELRKEEEDQKRAAAKAKELADAANRITEEKLKQSAEDARQKSEKEDLDRRVKAAAEAAAQEAAAKEAAAQEEAAKKSKLAQKPTPGATESSTVLASSQSAAQQLQVRDPTKQCEIQSPFVTSNAERERIHQEYLVIHGQLKELRKHVAALGKENKAIGEFRRKLKSRVGQITTDSKSNVEIRKHIIEILKMSIQDSGNVPQVDIRTFVSSSSPISKNQSPCNMPLLLIYYLHMLCKFVCKQFCAESNMAEPIMIQLAFIFSEQDFFWDGASLIDILLAKFHRACPVLFGIYGNEATLDGRTRLGWQRISGAFISEAEHRRRITGYAGGYAAISLRNFSKSSRKNPLPNFEYWRAMSRIVNTPEIDITKTHLIVLRGMLERYAERFILIYGEMAIVAMRHATRVFPARAAERFPDAAKEVSFLPEHFKKDIRLSL